jgi:hypothetical protein
MQRPVRYYITQNDDRAVVRSVPVAVARIAPVEETPDSAAPRPEVPRTDRAQARVRRLVRAAARRADAAR